MADGDPAATTSTDGNSVVGSNQQSDIRYPATSVIRYLISAVRYLMSE